MALGPQVYAFDLMDFLARGPVTTYASTSAKNALRSSSRIDIRLMPYGSSTSNGIRAPLWVFVFARLHQQPNGRRTARTQAANA